MLFKPLNKRIHFFLTAYWTISLTPDGREEAFEALWPWGLPSVGPGPFINFSLSNRTLRWPSTTSSCPRLLWAWKEEGRWWSPLPSPPCRVPHLLIDTWSAPRKWQVVLVILFLLFLFCIRIRSKYFQRNITFLGRKGTQLRTMPNPELYLCSKHALVGSSMAMVIQRYQMTRSTWWNAWLNPFIEQILIYTSAMFPDFPMLNFLAKSLKSLIPKYEVVTGTRMAQRCTSYVLHKGTQPRRWVGIEI